ncbi:MAG: anthranilate synthase component I [Gammaproteobacteria bacterium RBG_16_51_14]|nr:MAG: anthranilate synthase component I [Gammaproteobacteria bacterium RBG_16_51_14]
MTREEFARLAGAGYNRIPLMREVLADLDTPLSTYLKLVDGPYSYLLESVQGGEKWGRYSIIGLPATTVLRVCGHTLSVEEGGQVVEQRQIRDPLHEIETLQRQFRVPVIPGMPRFTGGLVGYFGYDCVRYIEPCLANNGKADPLGCPDILLMVSEQMIVFDNLSGKLYLIVLANPEQENAYDKAIATLNIFKQKLLHKPVQPATGFSPRSVHEADFVSGFTQQRFEQAVEAIKHYIVEGDAMQVVLSQRLSIPFTAPSINLYRALRCLNPSPYMYFLDLDDFQIAGSSPEILVRLEDNVVTVRPIAGTRPRGATEGEDQALERELLQDPKELAEHLMLIDLGRNDVGRVAEMGSVALTEKMIIERYSHVMHIVSNVTGRLKAGMTAVDVLRATFPAGTVSGAPKIRAMEIIDELEPVRRGIYAGAVGYLSWAGNMDTAITIRTAVIKDQMLHIQAGAGIVADSVPRREWDETMNKGRAIFRAVTLAENGLI